MSNAQKVDLDDIMFALERAQNLLNVFNDFYREELYSTLRGGKLWEVEIVANRHEQYDCVLMSIADLLDTQIACLDSAIDNELKGKKVKTT